MWFSFCENLCKPGASFPINLQVSLTRLENTKAGRKELRRKNTDSISFSFLSGSHWHYYCFFHEWYEWNRSLLMMCPDALNVQTCCYLQQDNLKQHTFCSHFMGFMVVINALLLLIISIDYYQCLLVMCVVSSIVTFHVGIYCVLAASAPLAILSSSAFLPPPLLYSHLPEVPLQFSGPHCLF